MISGGERTHRGQLNDSNDHSDGDSNYNDDDDDDDDGGDDGDDDDDSDDDDDDDKGSSKRADLVKGLIPGKPVQQQQRRRSRPVKEPSNWVDANRVGIPVCACPPTRTPSMQDV